MLFDIYYYYYYYYILLKGNIFLLIKILIDF